MLDFPITYSALGLQLVQRQMKCARVSLVKGKPKIEKIFDFPVTTSHVKPLYMHEFFTDHSFLVSGLKGDEVLVRPLHFPFIKNKDIEAALNFQAEPQLPYPVENAILDYIKLKQSSQETDTSLLAVRKNDLEKHLETLKVLQIEPEAISCLPVALANYSTLFSLHDTAYLILYLDQESLTCVLTKEGKPISSYTINVGIQALTEALISDQESTDLPQIDFTDIDSSKYPNLYKAVDQLRLQATKIIFAICKESRSDQPTKIVLAGEGHTINNLAYLLYNQINIPFQDIADHSSISRNDLLTYSIPIGLALGALVPSSQMINFRQQEYVYPFPWKRLKQPMMVYSLFCLLLAASFYFFSQNYLEYLKDQTKQEYSELLSAAHKTYDNFESEYLTKNPHSQESTQHTPLAHLSSEDLLKRIAFLQKDLKPQTDSFPLHPNVPRVSDVIAWLSVHPNVKGNEQEALIQIENFSYTMVKRPEQKKRQEKYQVKIELEFSSTTPKAARELHDALIAPNDFVDPKGEVKWNSNRGKYRTSFYLKDKTFYPAN